MEELYTKYGQAMIQLKIWQNTVAQLEQNIQNELNKNGKKTQPVNEDEAEL